LFIGTCTPAPRVSSATTNQSIAHVIATFQTLEPCYGVTNESRLSTLVARSRLVYQKMTVCLNTADHRRSPDSLLLGPADGMFTFRTMPDGMQPITRTCVYILM